MKKQLVVSLLLFATITFGQKKPEVYKSYWDNINKFISNFLVLSTDGLFFYSSSCECGTESYAKGNWKIANNILTLSAFDSTKSFPRSTVSFLNGSSTDTITIKSFDYFNKPIKHLTLGVIDYDTTKLQGHYEFADTDGQLKIPRNIYRGFYLIYETSESPFNVGRNPYYYFESGTREVIIHIDFASAGFDRIPVPINYGKQIYKMKNGSLFSRNRSPDFIAKNYDEQ